MEKHLWAEEAFVANVKFYQIIVERFMHKSFEFVRLDYSASVIYFFFVELSIFFQYVLTNITVLLLDFGCDFVRICCWKLFASVL